MRIAVFHNRYVQRGGEDGVVENETELLRKAGHEVHLFGVDNRDILSFGDKLRAGLASRWNEAMGRRAAAFLAERPVDVGHVHNFFPLLSPAVHAALRECGVPVVQTLHNYRLFCANGAFLRDGAPCEDCVAKGPWNAVRYGCWGGSRLRTALWARATVHQRRAGLWTRWVDRFVAPSEFLRRKVVEGGLPADRIVVKPNAVPDPGEPGPPGRAALFVGRLSPEKGVRLLLEAWRGMKGHPLEVVGTGPEEAALRRQAEGLPGVSFRGGLAADAVRSAMARAAFVVVPSIWYENFPLVVAEAQAAGRAVVASHPTAMSDLVEHERTGLLFERGSAPGLAAACARLVDDAAFCSDLGRAARRHYEDELTPERSLERLEALYRDVIDRAASPAPRPDRAS